MRCLLVDHARAKATAKRGDGNVPILPETELAGIAVPPDLDLIALDEALDRLAQTDRRQSELVELRFFGGLTIDEVAAVLRISPATVSREWMVARAWLDAQLKGPG